MNQPAQAAKRDMNNIACPLCGSIVPVGCATFHFISCRQLTSHRLPQSSFFGCTFILGSQPAPSSLQLPAETIVPAGKEAIELPPAIDEPITEPPDVSIGGQTGTICLSGSPCRTTYRVFPPPGIDFDELQAGIDKVLGELQDTLSVSESEGGKASSLLALSRFMIWNGSADLETSIKGNRLAGYLRDLGEAKRNNLRLSMATQRNVSSSLRNALEALATTDYSPKGLQSALTVVSRSSRKYRRSATKERAELLTEQSVNPPNFTFGDLRHVVSPALEDMEFLCSTNWKEACGAIVASLYCYGLAARPRALKSLQVKDGIDLAEGRSVISGKLKNRQKSVATIFRLSDGLARKAMHTFCYDRDEAASLFSKSRSSIESYARPASLLTWFFERKVSDHITTTKIRKLVETLAGEALSAGSITSEERSKIAEAEDHSLHVAKTVYEVRKKVANEESAQQVFEKLTGLSTSEENSTTRTLRSSKKRYCEKKSGTNCLSKYT